MTRDTVELSSKVFCCEDVREFYLLLKYTDCELNDRYLATLIVWRKSKSKTNRLSIGLFRARGLTEVTKQIRSLS